MTVQQLPASATPAEILEILDRDGCVILRRLASDPLMAQLQAELEPHFARTPTCEGDFVGWRTKRMGGLIVKSAACRELVLHPTVLAVMEGLLGPYCSRIQLNLTQAIQIRPGEREQILHRDEELFPGDHGGKELMANALWAYDDFTAENGATRVLVGSHRKPLDRTPPPEAISQAVMPRGSVLIYRGSVVHSGGRNISNAPRTAITMSYCLGWLRQAENQYLTVPPAVAATFPEQLQRLIGYSIHEPNLGWYEGQDPHVVLEGGEGAPLAARDYMPPAVVELLRQHYEAQAA